MVSIDSRFRGNDKWGNEIATLSSKVRNDGGRKKIKKEIRRMDSRLRGNDIRE
jgi:hypothetical protein